MFSAGKRSLLTATVIEEERLSDISLMSDSAFVSWVSFAFVADLWPKRSLFFLLLLLRNGLVSEQDGATE